MLMQCLDNLLPLPYSSNVVWLIVISFSINRMTLIQNLLSATCRILQNCLHHLNYLLPALKEGYRFDHNCQLLMAFCAVNVPQLLTSHITHYSCYTPYTLPSAMSHLQDTKVSLKRLNA